MSDIGKKRRIKVAKRSLGTITTIEGARKSSSRMNPSDMRARYVYNDTQESDTVFKTQEELLAYVSQMMEARGWQKEWVNISTAGMILVRFKARNGVAFTMSLEDMQLNGQVLPDVSDLYVD